MKYIVLILFPLFAGTLSAQTMELICGINSNRFFDLQKEDNHINSSYNSGLGYCIRLGIDDIKVDWLKLRFTVSFDKYSGKAVSSDNALGGSNTIAATVDKSVLSIGIFPATFRIIDRFDLNFGIEIGRLIDESFSGTHSGFQNGQSNYNKTLQDIDNNFNAKSYFGLRGRVAYDINLNDQWAISPQYSYYFGLTNEFQDFNVATRSMRHYFCIGLQRKLKSK